MATFGQIMKWLMELLSSPIHIYGFTISIFQIFVFGIVAAASASVLRAILH